MKKNAGFTLVEIMIASVLLAVVLLFVYFFIHYWMGSFFQNQGKTQAQSDAFRLVNTIVTELREIEAGETGQFALEQAADASITYYIDTDNDRRIERVRYYLSGEQLYQGIVEPTGSPGTYDLATEKVQVVASELVNGTQPVFYYYNSNWPVDTTNNPLTTNRILQTSYIGVSLMVRAEDLTKDGIVVATAGAQLRTLKTNYQIAPTVTPTPTPTASPTPLPSPTPKK